MIYRIETAWGELIELDVDPPKPIEMLPPYRADPVPIPRCGYYACNRLAPCRTYCSDDCGEKQRAYDRKLIRASYVKP